MKQTSSQLQNKKPFKKPALNGLSPAEYKLICEYLGKEPSNIELAIFSAMWSEHCSYKSSHHWLKLLPSDGKYVVGGKGENAGIVDIGDGMVAIFKIESHNHPSFIEPYQGAATGVGGIMRDIFTMGARPIANLNSLRFGNTKHPKTNFLLRNVVAGIGDYGNCVGIPTVGGELEFDEAYDNNILVNAMCVGIAKRDKIFYSAARGFDNIVLYVGSETGMDGIHGATMASASFGENEQNLKPTVQVGDPFIEKKLLEACLELMQHDAIVAIQDMGAAGLTSSSVEMAFKGNSGMELNLDEVPCRADNMTASDIMLSESQERMLIVIKPQAQNLAKKICAKWQLPISVIGTTNDTQKLTLKHKGKIVANIELSLLADKAPLYIREQQKTKTKIKTIPKQHLYKWPKEPSQCLLEMLQDANLCTRRAVSEQYDSTVMANTIRHSKGNAAIIRIEDSKKAIALSCDSLPFHCLIDPFEGGKLSVAKCWRNLSAVGALPLAFTNCLNFANPEKPKIMKQFVDVIKGMREAALELEFPVVSGNVSFYNETNNISIPPTPVIGGLGIINDLNCFADNYFDKPGLCLFLIGKSEKNLGQTRFYQIIHKTKAGEICNVKLEQEKNNGLFIRDIITKKLCKIVHDISAGGLMVALAKMMLEKAIGVDIKISENEKTPEFLFNETPSRYLIACEMQNYQKILDIAQQKKVIARHIGQTQGNSLKIDRLCDIHSKDILNSYENPQYQLLKPLT